MKLLKIKILMLVMSLITAFPLTGNAFNSSDPASASEIAMKASAESVMTQANNVLASSDVHIIWRYVDYLWSKGKLAEAENYIISGLGLDPFNYLYQARLALVQKQTGQNAKALERAKIVFDKAEESETVNLVKQILGKESIKPFPLIERKEFASPTVVLITLGKVEDIVVIELAQRATDYLGLQVVIFRLPGELPPAERSFFNEEIRRMRPIILGMSDVRQFLAEKNIEVSRLKANDGLFAETLFDFLKSTTAEKEADKFKTDMEKAKSSREQWKYDTLRDYLISSIKPFRTEKWLVVGVTAVDLFMENTNFVFAGTNPYNQAIISYKRFLGNFNNEPQNRKRLGKRLFKQFLSVFGLLNGMVRCTFPDCARVFPRTLAEHDEKPEYFCNDCKFTLEKVLKIKICDGNNLK